MASLRCESELGFDLDLPGPRDTLIPLGLFVHGLTRVIVSWGAGVRCTRMHNRGYLSQTPGHLAMSRARAGTTATQRMYSEVAAGTVFSRSLLASFLLPASSCLGSLGLCPCNPHLTVQPPEAVY